MYFSRMVGNHLKRCALMRWSFSILNDHTKCLVWWVNNRNTEAKNARPEIMLFLRMAGNRILQLANYRLEFWFMRFWLRLTFAYFCSYLHVLDVFHYFVSCQVALAFCKCCCRKATEILEKWCQNPSKFIQNPSKIQQALRSDSSGNQVRRRKPPQSRATDIFLTKNVFFKK